MTVFHVTFNATKTAMIALPIAVLVCVAIFILVKRPKTLKVDRFQKRWVELQKLCGDKTTWATAIVSADKLLDEALKKRKISGKNMGERLVQAQRIFTNNDSVWFGHKLHNRIDANPQLRLKETEVKEALVGIRQALKDLGALPK